MRKIVCNTLVYAVPAVLLIALLTICPTCYRNSNHPAWETSVTNEDITEETKGEILITSTQSKDYIIPNFMGDLEDAEDYAKDVVKDGFFKRAYVKDGSNLVISATEQEAGYWVERKKREFQDAVDDYINTTGNIAEYTDDYTALTLYIETNESMQDLYDLVILALHNSEMIQIFSGSQEWQIELKIIRPSSRKTIYDVIYPKERIHFGGELWDETEVAEDESITEETKGEVLSEKRVKPRPWRKPRPQDISVPLTFDFDSRPCRLPVPDQG